MLASTSVSRAVLLRAAGLRFRQMAPAINEAVVKRAAQAAGQSAERAALCLATAKAMAVQAPDALVLGADQILVCGGAWFDKPTDLQAARRQLQALRGRPHELATAATLCRNGSVAWQHTATPRLAMRDVSDAFLDAYLAAEGDRVLASVGAYRLEGPGMQLFAAVEGEHATILGLPMLRLLDFLRQTGMLLA